MSAEKVRSLLLVNSCGVSCSYSILFHCARYWAEQGNRVLFISKTPLKNLPFKIGKRNTLLSPDAFKLIQFMYLSDWQELLQQLYSIHLRHNPVSVIIVKNLENYMKIDLKSQNHDHISLICASLFYAVSTCSKLISQPAFLINDYVCADLTIEKSIVKNFFHNIWELKTSKNESDRTCIKLSKLSNAVNNEIVDYTFCENLEASLLIFEKVIKNIIGL